MKNIDREKGALGQKIAARIYRDRGYKVRFPPDPFGWYDLQASRSQVEIAVQVKCTTKRCASGYPISFDYLESQLFSCARSGFNEYQLVVVSLPKGFAYVFSQWKLQSYLNQALDDAKVMEHTPAIGLRWSDSVHCFQLNNKELAKFRYIQDRENPSQTGDLFEDQDY